MIIWDREKNEWLKKERNISFEDIELAILEDRVIDILEHPNREKYLNQKLLIVEIENYAYVAPYVEDEEGNIFLKTIFPSRKYTKKYLRGGKNDK
ncbi:MAG: hypothetical protein DSY60_01555 [Persephonella sp.]|nr:MAG: hypothetical protein DSY60_01555 [Persephonella sp.]